MLKGSRRCEICGKSISNLGRPAHMKMHVREKGIGVDDAVIFSNGSGREFPAVVVSMDTGFRIRRTDAPQFGVFWVAVDEVRPA